MTQIAADAAARATPGRDVKLIGLVSVAHLTSHFYQLVLPPIFPLLTASFGVGYTELGLLAALMSATSGLMQTPAGILVDRLGPARVLICGLGLYSTAILLLGLVPSFWWMAPLAVAVGLGNCVFHPADYAIMTAKVDPARLGRAFGAHTFAGNIGWVAAPAAVLSLTALFGWRAALAILGGAGLALTAYLISQRSVLRVDPAATRPQATAPTSAAGPARLLISGPIVLCFVYFALLSMAQIGLQTFLPSALVGAFGLSVETANLMLTASLVAGALGILGGGFAADRVGRHGQVIGIGLTVAAAASLGLALMPASVILLSACAAVAGLAIGATTPARDMLVRGAAPAGATGKVFGFVYSGLDLGGAVTPPLLGALLDHGMPRLVFVSAAATLLIAVVTTATVSTGGLSARWVRRRAA